MSISHRCDVGSSCKQARVCFKVVTGVIYLIPVNRQRDDVGSGCKQAEG